MSELTGEVRAVKVWFDEDNIWLALEDGRQIAAPLGFYPRLLHATKQQREHYEFIGPGIGIHWPNIYQDLSVAGILMGRKDRTSNPVNAV